MSQVTLGVLTKGIADELERLTIGQVAWRVYHDHGDGGQRLWAHMGDEPHAWSNLSGVDVLLGDAESWRAVLVLEIEERARSPKKLLGDVCAFALSEYLTTESDDRRYAITPETELWVCFPANPHGHQMERDMRALDRLPASWSGKRPVYVRLVASDSRTALTSTVCGALREWFRSRHGADQVPIPKGHSTYRDGAASG